MAVNEIGPALSNNTIQSGTYLAVGSGSSTINLPALANQGFGYTSGVTIQNISNQSVQGQLQYYNLDGTPQGNLQSFSISGQASQAFYQGAAGLPTGFYGTGVVRQTSGPANSLLSTINVISPNIFYTYTQPNN
jgi:hypothetical protein